MASITTPDGRFQGPTRFQKTLAMNDRYLRPTTIGTFRSAGSRCLTAEKSAMALSKMSSVPRYSAMKCDASSSHFPTGREFPVIRSSVIHIRRRKLSRETQSSTGCSTKARLSPRHVSDRDRALALQASIRSRLGR
jgi:hypothetical protein